ncbi:MAG: aromatic amino acid transport family protein [Candidatus Pacearchaeota archaeon]
MTDKKSLFTAAAILIGTVVGAGFLGIPGVVSKSGFFVGLFYLIFIFLIILFINLLLGEIVLRTKGHHQLSGYAHKYLGDKGKKLMCASQVFGIYFALLAYLIGISTSINFIFNYGNLNFALLIGIVVWVLFSFIISFKISSLRKLLGYGSLAIIFLILIITFIKFPQVDYENLKGFNLENIFLPFGVILFAFLGFSAMPEIEQYLHGKEKLLRKSLIIGTSVPFVIYLIFMFLIVGIYGNSVPELATLMMGVTVIILGILTMSNAYIALSMALKDMYVWDFSISGRKSWMFVVSVPLVLFIILNFLNFASFIAIISIGGVVSGGLTGILILLMIKKAKEKGNRKPEYSLKFNKFILYFIGLIFLLGIIYEILNVMGIV